MILETKRLIIDRFRPDHAAFILELLNSPGWLQYIGDRNVNSLEQARKFLETRLMQAYDQYGYGFSVILMKSTGQPIGGCGLINRDALEHPDIGYALLPEYAGMGYAFEAADATLINARDDLGLKKVLAICRQDNDRSIRLLKKLGFQYEKMIRLPDEDINFCRYEIDLY